MKQLVPYSRFFDYISAWPQQNSQMKMTTVLYTDMEAGSNYLSENCSYLTRDFFRRNPTSPYEIEPEAGAESQVFVLDRSKRVYNANDDDNYLKVDTQEMEAENEEEAPEEEEEDGKSLQQVCIYMQQVDWLTKTEEGQDMLKELVRNKDCQPLFQTKALKDIVNNLWRISRIHFVVNYFMTYFVLNFLPLLIMSFLIEAMEASSSILLKVFYNLTATVFFFGTFLILWSEIKELISMKWKYFLQIENYHQLSMVGVNVILVLYIIIQNKSIVLPDGYSDLIALTNLRVLMIFAILLNTMELFSRIRIFDFFAYFVRQIQEIVVDALPLGAMLGFIVLAQTLLFWLLDQNSAEPAYSGLAGFGNCLINSYRLALGDFEIAGDNFTDGFDDVIVFWVIFFVGTLISLLIILNMVIAIMGATFERVEQDQEAFIYREKLSLIINNYIRFSKSIRDQLNDSKYFLAIEVDPELDPIAKETPEERINQLQIALEKSLLRLSNDNKRISQSLEALYDRFCD